MSDDVLHPPRIRWLVEPTFDDDGVQRTSGIDQFGREHPDPCPHSPSVGLDVGVDPTYAAIQRLFIKHKTELAIAAEVENFESEEEANDFLIADDLFPPGNEPWEDLFLFPVPEEGRSAPLARGAPNGENRAPEDATRQPSSSQTASAGSASELLGETKVEKPIVGDRDRDRGSRSRDPRLGSSVVQSDDKAR